MCEDANQLYRLLPYRANGPVREPEAFFFYDLTRPPSTLSVWPVMKAASSLVRNDKAPTRSSGTSTRLIACRPATAVNSSSMVAKPGRGLRTSVPGERVSPGAMALTVMPSAATSPARPRVKPMMPPFANLSYYSP